MSANCQGTSVSGEWSPWVLKIAISLFWARPQSRRRKPPWNVLRHKPPVVVIRKLPILCHVKNKKALLRRGSARDSSAAWWIGSGWSDVFSYPSLIRRPRSLSCRWNFRVPFRVRKLESWGYSVVKVAWSYLEPSLTNPPVWRTDRQTDRRTGDGI